ncbi:MAG: hypothetical protein IJY01_00380 [Clostridia bacterium]|nr:hypothetical protein [Clostridia bacterium]
MKVIVNEVARKKTNLSTVDLIEGKTYEVISISKKLKWFSIVDESGEDYLYPPSLFDIVENE